MSFVSLEAVELLERFYQFHGRSSRLSNLSLGLTQIAYAREAALRCPKDRSDALWLKRVAAAWTTGGIQFYYVYGCSYFVIIGGGEVRFVDLNVFASGLDKTLEIVM